MANTVVKRKHDICEKGDQSLKYEDKSKRVKPDPELMGEMVDADDWDSEDTIVPPYKATNDEFPRHGAYCPRFPELLEIAPKPIRMLLDKINGTANKPDDIQEFCRHLERASRIHVPASKIVAVLGETGVGKTSLINALLDYFVDTFECNMGESGTFVPHEYNKAQPNQNMPCEAQINFYGDRVREQHITTYFSHCYRFYAKSAKGEDEDKDEQQPQQLEAESALENLKALFCDRKELSSSAAAIKFIRSAKSDSDPKVIDQLKAWLNRLLKTAGVKENKVVLEANDMTTLHTHLLDFSRNMSSHGDRNQVPSLWPIVRLIRIYATPARASLLGSDLTFAELPGTTYTDQIRAKSAAGYVNSCNAVVLVAAIDKAQTNSWLADNLCKHLRTGRCILVLTKTDLLPGTVHLKALSPDERQHMAKYKAKIDEERQQYTRLGKELQRAPRSDKAKLRNNILKHESNIRRIEAKKNQLSIAARNEAVSRYFKDKYGSQNLNVFCVSNTLYQLHNSGYRKGDAPDLTVQDTQIPAFRRHLFLLPAKTKLDAVVYYSRTIVPLTLNIGRSWYLPSETKRKEEIATIVYEPEEGFSQVIDQLRNGFKEDFNSRILMPITQNVPSWCDETENTAERWRKAYKFSSYTFIRHQGCRQIEANDHNHSTNYVVVSWNDQLFEPVATTLESLFQKYAIAALKSETDSLRKIENYFDRTVERLKKQDESLLLPMDVLIKQLGYVREAVRNIVITGVDRLRDDLRKIRCDACVDTRHSYSGKRMESVYRGLNTNGSNESSGKQISAMVQEVSKANGVLMNILIRAEADAHLAMNTFHRTVFEKSRAAFQTLKTMFNRIFDEKAVETEGKIFRENVLLWIMESEALQADRPEALVKECLQFAERS